MQENIVMLRCKVKKNIIYFTNKQKNPETSSISICIYTHVSVRLVTKYSQRT